VTGTGRAFGKAEAIGWASEIPLVICNIQRRGPSTGLPTNVEQSDLHQRSSAVTAIARSRALAASEDCFYIAIEARIAKYNTPVFILSDTSLATRIEAFDEPDLSKLMIDPKPDLTPRQTLRIPSTKSHGTFRRARAFSAEISAARRSRARRDGSPNRQ
jgi:pyruvate/2-oxoacid:ferredoxin oxidoreductase alpha subunit